MIRSRLNNKVGCALVLRLAGLHIHHIAATLSKIDRFGLVQYKLVLFALIYVYLLLPILN